MNLQSKIFTKFLILMHVLFLISCHSMPKNESKVDIKKKSLQFIPYNQNNWKIIRQEVVYENGIKMNSISSIWILDENFPLELVTLDDLNPDEDAYAAYNEGDKIILRSTDDFYPASESLTTEIYNHKFTQCNEDEFRMFARIYSGLNYTGVVFDNSPPAQLPWFKFGNVICAKIERDTSNKIGLLNN